MFRLWFVNLLVVSDLLSKIFLKNDYKDVNGLMLRSVRENTLPERLNWEQEKI